MVIKEYFARRKAKKEAQQEMQRERYTYSPEKMEQLQIAKATAGRQERFEREKRQFEQQQMKKAYERSSAGRLSKYQQKMLASKSLRKPVSVQTSQAVAGIAGRRIPLKYQGKKGYAGYNNRMMAMQQQQNIARMMAKNPQMAQYYAQTGQVPEQAYQQTQNPQLQANRQTISPPPIQQYPPKINTQESSGVQMVGNWDMLKWRMPDMRSPEPNTPMKVFQVDSPVTNPQGDWYTEPDFFTGRQVLKRRNTGGFGLW
jgi:hypothetical protein